MTANWKNRTLWTDDNLEIMCGMNSESVDLIYLDPPFNSNRNYEAPIGSEAAGAAFKDAWTLDDVDLAWHGMIAEHSPDLYSAISMAGYVHSKGMQAYLIMMSVRLLELRRILKSTGSIYLHVDPTAGHYLKIIMDAVFDKDNFRNEIAWCYKGPSGSSKNFPQKHDVILRYTKSEKWVFNAENVRIPYKELHSDKGKKSQIWSNKGKLQDETTKKIYEQRGKIPEDFWIDIPSGGHISPKERTGYPTQKPLALLNRIIQASSNEDDMVFDPFCGCATTLVAAEKLQRQWTGIDISPLAVKLVTERLKNEMGMFYKVYDRNDIPKRTDMGKLLPYKTHKHTLYGRQEGVCVGCKTHFPFRNLTIDHILSQQKGGLDNIENLQLLCGACNSKKGAKSQEEFLAMIKKEGFLK